MRSLLLMIMLLGGVAGGACSAAGGEPTGSPATPEPTSTAVDAASASPSDRPAATPRGTPTQSPTTWPTKPPFPGIPSLEGDGSPMEGGCRTVYYLTEVDVGDQCGPFFFVDVLRLDPVTALVGEAVAIQAPAGYVFSVADASLSDGWSVKVAPASEVQGLQGESTGMPSDIGTVLAQGIGPDATVSVTLPTKPGTYVVQLVGPLARDGWTFAGSIYFWLVRVGS